MLVEICHLPLLMGLRSYTGLVNQRSGVCPGVDDSVSFLPFTNQRFWCFFYRLRRAKSLESVRNNLDIEEFGSKRYSAA